MSGDDCLTDSLDVINRVSVIYEATGFELPVDLTLIDQVTLLTLLTLIATLTITLISLNDPDNNPSGL